MIKKKNNSTVRLALTIILFLFCNGLILANNQPDSNVYKPATDKENIYIPGVYYENIFRTQADNMNIYTPKADNSDIHIVKSNNSNIFNLNQDLIDIHHPSLYESIYGITNNGNLIIVKDSTGNIVSILAVE